jgi:hypothetical protein
MGYLYEAWGYTVLPLSVCPSVQDIFRRIFLSNCWWQKSDIWSQASYRYTILRVAFLDPSDSYFLFADLVGFYTHWTYMHIFRHIFLSNYWWQRSDIWSQAYLYDACDQISDFCHQQLLRKMRRKISWTDGQTDRGKTVYPPPPSRSGGIIRAQFFTLSCL